MTRLLRDRCCTPRGSRSHPGDYILGFMVLRDLIPAFSLQLLLLPVPAMDGGLRVQRNCPLLSSALGDKTLGRTLPLSLLLWRGGGRS